MNLTPRSTLHALPSYQCCENTTFRVPSKHWDNSNNFLRPFFVSSRHNYGKFRLHGLQPSCQDTMPSGSLTCEIPILEVAKKHGMRSKSSSPLEFFYWSSPKIMQKQLHLSLNSPCSNWKTDNNETSRSNSGSQEKLPFLCLLTAARWRNKTLLSRRQYKLRVKEFHCKLMQVQLQILLWSLCHIYFSTMRFSCKVVCHWIRLNLQMSK